jgi:low temperature requirement protein LtrA
LTTQPAPPSRLRLTPMRPRDPHEPGRVASSLELFFDLVFVVAVSFAGVELHHALTEGHIAHGVSSYAFVFFAIWWAWMNFTWFATSFGVDDWLYRVLTFVQMGGVLVLAAGIQPAFQEHRRLTVLVFSYVVMRAAMVAQWLRASRSAGTRRGTAHAYAAGVAGVQALWLLSLLLSDSARSVAVIVLIVAELAVPVVAERRGSTPWHTHHITERYGLFTLIVLGETLLASANAIIDALHDHEKLGPLVSLSILTLVVTAAMWWIYFWPPHAGAIRDLTTSFRYGYVHYFVFAAAGALSAGIEVQIDVLEHESHLSRVAASFTATVPVAVFVVGIWWIALRETADRVVNVVVPVGGLLVLLDPVLTVPLLVPAIVLIAVVAVLVSRPPVPRHAAVARPASG